MKVKLSEVSSGFTKNIAQKDLDNNNGCYPVYGASGYIKNVDFYVSDKSYIGVVKDGSGVGRVDLYPAYSSLLGTMQYILPNENIDITYLMYALRYMKLGSLYSGAAIPHIYYKNYRNNELNYRDINKQKEIAIELKQIENAIELCDKRLFALDELVKSRFIEMFGDPISNPFGWDKVSLSEIAEIKIGPFGSLLHKEDYIEHGHPLVNPSHIIDSKIAIDEKLTISDEKYDELKSYHLQVGDVVLGRRGEMGRCAIVKTEGLLCGTGSLIIRANKDVTSEFIQNIISFPTYKEYIESMAIGQTMLNLNVPIVSNFQIIKPPLDVQKQYYDLVKLTDKSKLIVQKQIEDLQELLDSKMDEYFG